MEAKFGYGDTVSFKIGCDGEEYEAVGKIVVVDYGTFLEPDTMSYDVEVTEGFGPLTPGMWVKHIHEEDLNAV